MPNESKAPSLDWTALLGEKDGGNVARWIEGELSRYRDCIRTGRQNMPCVTLRNAQGENTFMALDIYDDESANYCALAVRGQAAREEAIQSIMVMEAWRYGDPEEGQLLRQQGIQPQDDPNRREEIMVTVEVAGAHYSGSQQILREGKRIAFGPVEWARPEDVVGISGRFTHFLPANKGSDKWKPPLKLLLHLMEQLREQNGKGRPE